MAASYRLSEDVATFKTSNTIYSFIYLFISNIWTGWYPSVKNKLLLRESCKKKKGRKKRIYKLIDKN